MPSRGRELRTRAHIFANQNDMWSQPFKNTEEVECTCVPAWTKLEVRTTQTTRTRPSTTGVQSTSFVPSMKCRSTTPQCTALHINHGGGIFLVCAFQPVPDRPHSNRRTTDVHPRIGFLGIRTQCCWDDLTASYGFVMPLGTRKGQYFQCYNDLTHNNRSLGVTYGRSLLPRTADGRRLCNATETGP